METWKQTKKERRKKKKKMEGGEMCVRVAAWGSPTELQRTLLIDMFDIALTSGLWIAQHKPTLSYICMRKTYYTEHWHVHYVFVFVSLCPPLTTIVP